MGTATQHMLVVVSWGLLWGLAPTGAEARKFWPFLPIFLAQPRSIKVFESVKSSTGWYSYYQ